MPDAMFHHDPVTGNCSMMFERPLTDHERSKFEAGLQSNCRFTWTDKSTIVILSNWETD